jgi:hypothetical protein
MSARCRALWQIDLLACRKALDHIEHMDHLDKCTSALRPLIEKGDTADLHLAEKAVNAYVAATPRPDHASALESVKAAVVGHREASSGDHQLYFADAINNYIEKLMRQFE